MADHPRRDGAGRPGRRRLPSGPRSRRRRVDFALVDSDGAVLQREVPHVLDGSYFQLSTRRFVDTARRAVEGTILVRITHTSGERWAVPIAHVRPARLCAGLSLVDREIMLDGAIRGQDLAVHIWTVTAPWQAATTVSVIDGAAQLPEELVNVGPLLCEVFVDDPWIPLDPPEWPAEDAFRVVQPGWLRDVENTARDHLSRFLAGEGRAPEVIGSMPEAWAALRILPTEACDVPTQQLKGALVRILRQDPRSALEALGGSTLSAQQRIPLLIRAELVNKSFAADSTLNDLHPDPWVGCMVEIADLPSLYTRQMEVADERAETVAYLADKGGDLLIDVLRFGKAEELSQGLFDKSVECFASLPATQVEQIIECCRLVPGALLDVDTRVGSNIDAFHRRADWMRFGWSDGFVTTTSYTLRAIKQCAPKAYRAIETRSDALAKVEHSYPPMDADVSPVDRAGRDGEAGSARSRTSLDAHASGARILGDARRAVPRNGRDRYPHRRCIGYPLRLWGSGWI